MAQNLLAAKLAVIIGKTGAVLKTGRNDAQSYNYQRAADVANEVRGLLAEAGVAFTMSVDTVDLQKFERTGKSPMFFTTIQGTAQFVDAESGESFSFGIAGTGSDYGGDKGLYKAMTGALKYALRSTFLIPDIADDPETVASDQQDTKTNSTSTPVGAVVTVVNAGTSSLADARQKAHLRATAREHGIDGGAFKAFVAALTGRTTSKDLTVEDYQGVIAELAKPESEAVAIYKVWTGEVKGDQVGETDAVALATYPDDIGAK